jgi:soluble lytic murein transglycosylase-like protein
MRDPLDHLLSQALRRWMPALTPQQRGDVRFIYRFHRHADRPRSEAYARAAQAAQAFAAHNATTASSSPISGGSS